MTSTLRPYTPSRESAADLDARTVGRDDVLKVVHQRLRSAARTKNRSHTLLVGPRGSGKSHVIEVALHRLRQDPALVDRLAVAKIAEDAVGVASYGDLLLELLRSLSPGDPLLAEGRARRDPLAVERAIEAEVADRALVAVIENLDRLFTAMGTAGQQHFRAWVETSRAVVLLASSPLLFQAVGSRDEPWFGSFAVEHLDDLDLAQGRQLLRQLAESRGDTALTTLLDSEKGEARLAALHALSGGSPRVWVILGDCASVTGLDELVPTVEKLLEDLVPYYQQRLWELPANEQRLVTELGRGPEMATVKELAAATGLNETTAGKTLNRLAEARWVRAEKRSGTDQRTTWYRLREPMLYHHFQYRSTAGEPLRLLVQVLRIWFDPRQRRRCLADVAPRSRAEEHLVATFAEDGPRRSDSGYARRDIDELLVEARLWVAGNGIGDRRSGAVLEVLISAVRDGADMAAKVAQARGIEHDPLIAAAIGSGLERSDGTPENALGRLLDVTADAAMDPNVAVPLGLVAACWDGVNNPARAAERLGELATTSDGPLMLTVRDELAFWLSRSHRHEDALNAIGHVVADRVRVLGSDHPDTLESRHNHAFWVGESGLAGKAARLYADVVADRVRVLGSDHPDTLASRQNYADWKGECWRAGEAAEILADVVADRARVLGSDHPDTLSSRHKFAFWLGESGRYHEATSALEEVINDQVRVLGPDHAHTLVSRHNYACFLGESGQAGEAVTHLSEVVADRVRVLGAAHPDTLRSRRHHAFWLGESGRADEALMRVVEVVSDEIGVLDSNHPGSLASRWNHASMRGKLARVGEATRMCRAMLRDPQGLSNPLQTELLLALIRQAMAGVAADRRRVLEADITPVLSAAISVLRGDAGVDHLPPELRPAFENTIGGTETGS